MNTQHFTAAEYREWSDDMSARLVTMMDVLRFMSGGGRAVTSFYALPLRECDNQGCGHYGASRGSRKHKGVDLACNPGTAICSPVTGTVTKLG